MGDSITPEGPAHGGIENNASADSLGKKGNTILQKPFKPMIFSILCVVCFRVCCQFLHRVSFLQLCYFTFMSSLIHLISSVW